MGLKEENKYFRIVHIACIIKLSRLCYIDYKYCTGQFFSVAIVLRHIISIYIFHKMYNLGNEGITLKYS